MLAKEVVIGSLNSLYAQMGDFMRQLSNFNFWGSLQAQSGQFLKILAQLGHALLNPILASAPNGEIHGRFME